MLASWGTQRSLVCFSNHPTAALWRIWNGRFSLMISTPGTKIKVSQSGCRSTRQEELPLLDVKSLAGFNWPVMGLFSHTNVAKILKWVGRIIHDWYWSVLSAFMWNSVGFPGGSAAKESACNVGDLGLIPGLGRSPGEGKGYPLQHSGLENSMDCIIHGVAKSQTWLTFTSLHGILLWFTQLSQK